MPSQKFRIAALTCLTALLLGACNPQTVKSNQNSDAVNNPENLLNLLDPDVKTEEQAFAKAEAALSEGKTDNALFYYVKTMQFNKKNIKALERIASIHRKNKQPELARNIYKEILSIDNGNPYANENLGLYYLDNGQTGMAKERLTQAVKNNGRSWKSHNGLGVIADLEHNSAEAIAHYEAALAIDPANPMLLNNLGYSHYLAGDEIKARSLFNQALGQNNKYKRAIYNLALIEIKRGAFPSATALFNRVMPVHESFNNIGYICMLNGQYAAAEEYLKRAIDESPVYFPKAQENLNTLLSLETSRAPYQQPRQDASQLGAGIQPDLAIETETPEPAAVETVTNPAKTGKAAAGNPAPEKKTENIKKKLDKQAVASKSEAKTRRPEKSKTRPASLPSAQLASKSKAVRKNPHSVEKEKKKEPKVAANDGKTATAGETKAANLKSGIPSDNDKPSSPKAVAKSVDASPPKTSVQPETAPPAEQKASTVAPKTETTAASNSPAEAAKPQPEQNSADAAKPEAPLQIKKPAPPQNIKIGDGDPKNNALSGILPTGSPADTGQNANKFVSDIGGQ